MNWAQIHAMKFSSNFHKPSPFYVLQFPQNIKIKTGNAQIVLEL